MAALQDGKICIVTGGCGGLGLAISKAFLAEGAIVIATDISDKALSTCSEDLSEAERSRLHPFKADSTSTEDIDKLFAHTIKEFGRVDVLVNNAGVNDYLEPVGACSMEMWEKNIKVNLTGPFVTMTAAVKQFEKQELVRGARGVILNVISAAGTSGYRAGAAYTASKHGLAGLTKNTAAYYGPKGIRCLAVMPGAMRTGMGHDSSQFHAGGMELVGKSVASVFGHFDWNPVEQVARSIVVLCTDGLGTINGALVPTDNGWTAL